MRLDPKRKRHLEGALRRVQERYTNGWVHCVGLATIIEEDQLDPRATGEEIREILREQGVKGLDNINKNSDLS